MHYNFFGNTHMHTTLITRFQNMRNAIMKTQTHSFYSWAKYKTKGTELHCFRQYVESQKCNKCIWQYIYNSIDQVQKTSHNNHARSVNCTEAEKSNTGVQSKNDILNKIVSNLWATSNPFNPQKNRCKYKQDNNKAIRHQHVQTKTKQKRKL